MLTQDQSANQLGAIALSLNRVTGGLDPVGMATMYSDYYAVTTARVLAKLRDTESTIGLIKTANKHLRVTVAPESSVLSFGLLRIHPPLGNARPAKIDGSLTRGKRWKAEGIIAGGLSPISLTGLIGTGASFQENIVYEVIAEGSDISNVLIDGAPVYVDQKFAGIVIGRDDVHLHVVPASQILRQLDRLPVPPEPGGFEPSPLPPALNLNGWRVGDILGAGGQAVAYRASDSSGRVSVIKVLKPWAPQINRAPSEADHVSRFQREVRVLQQMGSLGCPRIVSVLDSDLEGTAGPPWYAMPFYSAGAMVRTDASGNLTGWAEATYKGKLDRVLEIAQKIAETLAFMHDRNAIHRDVHTGNIFFDEQGGDPILGDFGLAHFETPSDGLRTGQRVEFGPWRWRPMELIAGSANQRDPKSDVFLLGGVIYEALSGGEYIASPEYPIGTFLHELPAFNLNRFVKDKRIGALNSLLRKMLAQDPANRNSANQVAIECERLRG